MSHIEKSRDDRPVLAVPLQDSNKTPYLTLPHTINLEIIRMNLTVHFVPLFIYPTRRQDCQGGSQPRFLGSIKLCPFPFASTFNLRSIPETLPWAHWDLWPVIIQIPQTLTQFFECSFYSLALQESVSPLKTLLPSTLWSMQTFLPNTFWPWVLLDSQWHSDHFPFLL